MPASDAAGTATGPETGRPADLQDVKHEVEDLADTAVERGLGFAAALRSNAISYAEGKKGEASQSVASVAASLRDSGKSFEDKPNLKAFFDTAAEGLDDLAGSIERRSFADLYTEAETYARRAPVTVAVATFAAGFLLSRFVKATSRPETDTYDGYRA
ncbi:hypothetical protein MMB17_01725 [Methylobacterium organophilum]|uniref:hypothetical protein n=1 Tax=Methylobacterium organophilum TaxID=410 RepID=UPI001F13DE1D|nr:hypothetical protein [Methylobacterium organophilum]UMY18101.1 hypothetical protein MMB17_01725 [Methylobacterium organophilum]